MKSSISLLSLVLSAALCAGCGGGVAVGDGTSKSEERLVGPFTRMSVNDGLAVEQTTGERSVKVVGDAMFVGRV